MAPGVVNAEGPFSGAEPDVQQVARMVEPSVVTVIEQHVELRQRRHRAPLTPYVHTRVGSGVAVEEDLILTTASVVVGAERVLVRTANGIQSEGRLVGSDLVFNLALVKVEGLKLPSIRFSERITQPGDWVMTLGTSYRGQSTQSVGTVATIYSDPRQPLLQLTNSVYPGNSGGAALNARGELIGLVQGELGSPEPTERHSSSDRRPGGMSFVQPVQVLRPAYEVLRRDGRVPHGYLGLSTSSASVESESEPGARVPIGALVESVQPESPAAKAGIRKGDLVVGFDRDRVEFADQLARWVSSTSPGTSIELVWVRNEIQKRSRIALGESPTAAPQWAPDRSENAVAPPRIADLERQIQQLNLELRRLKNDSSAFRR